MNDLWRTAERLRAVQTAKKRFLTLWALAEAGRMFDAQYTARERATDHRLKDLTDNDWSPLYRGSVLDD